MTWLVRFTFVLNASLAASLLAVAILQPASVHAASLGSLTVQSGRNEPLRAEIQVVAVNPAEAESLTAQLASRQSHEQARVPYTAGTSAIVLTLEPRSSETMAIVLRTREPVEEATIAIVVELRSRLTEDTRPYRIDTTGVAQTISPVVANTAANTATNTAANDPASARPARAASVFAPALAATRGARKSPTSSNLDNQASSAAVSKGDILAQIAARVKADDIALDRAMLAIFRANPKAFFGSIHQLKANQTLAIPSREAMLSNADSFIASELRRHSEIFQAYKARVAAAPAAANTNPSAQAPREGSAGGNAKFDRLVLSKSNGGVLAPDEQQTAIDNALKEANSRISDLERNLSDLGKLAELKDRQIAQASLSLKRLTSEASALPGITLPVQASTAGTATAPTDAPASVAKAVAAASATLASKTAENLAASKPAAATNAAAESLSPAEAAAAAAASASSAKSEQVMVNPAVTKASNDPESSLWDYALYGGLAIIGLVAALIFKRYRSGRDPKSKFDKMVEQHSMFDLQNDTDSKTLDVQGHRKKSPAKSTLAAGPRTLKAEV
jgi:pilus assembly protein FimV